MSTRQPPSATTRPDASPAGAGEPAPQAHAGEPVPPDPSAEADRLLALALRFLNRRERTKAEVRQRLEREAADPAAIQSVLAELAQQGLLDDARYARMFTEDKRALEGWGEERIRRTLLERGIDRELAAAALAAAGEAEPESELERAVALLRRRFPEPPRDRRERERALGVLLRKGYETELALDAVRAHARESPPART